MRGKGGLAAMLSPLTRITPAYAGKSPSRCECRASGRDHPRLCGEKYSLHNVKIKVKGSPPPMRGKVNVLLGTA